MIHLLRVLWLPVILSSGMGVVGCGHTPETHMPSWVMGTSDRYPQQRYLLGVGEADSRQVAEDRAYGALAKIFQATVHSEADDTELYRVLEREGMVADERTLSLRHSTTVTAQKVIEQAAILDRWAHPSRPLFYVLAGIDRQQADGSLQDRIVQLDDTARAELSQARMSGQPLTRLGHYSRALEALDQRSRLNEDLRTIRVSGTGVSSRMTYNQVSREFREFVEQNVLVQVKVRGDQALAMRTAIIDGLRQRGLPVLLDQAETDSRHPGPSPSPTLLPNVVVQGHVHLWPLDVPDPLFTYVRWCGEFVIEDQVLHRIIGVAGQSGREGHITEKEALSRASGAMQATLTKSIASALSRAILNGGSEPSESSVQACPTVQP